MFQLFKSAASALAVLIGERIVDRVSVMLTRAMDGGGSMPELQSLEKVANSQAMAAAVYARFGLSGLASAYDAGIISVVDFAAYVVKGESYRIAPMSVDRIKTLEGEAVDANVFSSAFSDLADVTTDPEGVQTMYAYLLASARNY
jgi:gamma-glutamylcyclotransferase (GGCT)/AIG2-like uncharacterized protein YtfP